MCTISRGVQRGADMRTSQSLWGWTAGAIGPAAARRPYTTWSDYGGSADAMQYSALTEINRTNIRQLEPAWSLKAPGPDGRFAFSPLIVDDVMFVVGKDSAVVALNAATGQVIW